MGRFNKGLDTKWNLVIEELDNRIERLTKKGFKLPKVTVEFKHQTIESESIFTDDIVRNWRPVEWVSPLLKGGFRPMNYIGNIDLPI